MRSNALSVTTNFAPNAGRGAPPILWHAPLQDPSGYAEEARHFLFAIDRYGLDVAARAIRWSDKTVALPPERERKLLSLQSRPTPVGAVHVFHILAPYFSPISFATANIGRTMFETDRLPDGWAAACNRMDRVWVPSEFNRETFAAAGVDPQILRVVPGTLDFAPFDPSCEPLQIPGARAFNFLAVFDWTLRKGWDVLLKAFIEEFKAGDDVSLTLKTHSSLGYTVDRIVEFAATYIEQDLGRDLNTIPAIVFQDDFVPDALMPNLYRAADCYVVPSRGEGWGRPYMEAMAMGVPVIATGWSGQTAFMRSDNSLLVDYDLADVPEVAWLETPTYRGHRWAEPRVDSLRAQMRLAYEDRPGTRATAANARDEIRERFSYEAVATIIEAELHDLTREIERAA